MTELLNQCKFVTVSPKNQMLSAPNGDTAFHILCKLTNIIRDELTNIIRDELTNIIRDELTIIIRDELLPCLFEDFQVLLAKAGFNCTFGHSFFVNNLRATFADHVGR